MTDLSGIIVINKPCDKSSAFISRLCGKILGVQKIGHLGTLDPFASGVLPIALNNATKLIHYINIKKKVYEFTIIFGIQTNTADKTGIIVNTSSIIPSRNDLENVIKNFMGKIEQVPHAFSAIKINGRKAYEIARKGQIPDIKKRSIEIFDIEVIDQIDEKTFRLRASVSPGTYIRSLCEDIAKSLNTLAYVESLHRIQDGKFSIKNSITLDELREKMYNLGGVLYPIENLLDDIPVVFVSKKDAIDLGNGKILKSDVVVNDSENISVLSEDGFFAICRFLEGNLIPKRIIRKQF